MLSKDLYAALWLRPTATDSEIKSAYKKLAMKHHPDRNKGNAASEAKFKEISEAYNILSDSSQKRQYDTQGTDPFSQGRHSHTGSRSRGSAGPGANFGGFEDIFSQFGGGRNGGFEFDTEDIFGEHRSTSRGPKRPSPPPEELPDLDVRVTKEIPIVDFLLGAKVDVETVYSKQLTLTVKPGTKPGTKFKISGKGRTSDGRTGDMYVTMEARMSVELTPEMRRLLESIRDQI